MVMGRLAETLACACHSYFHLRPASDVGKVAMAVLIGEARAALCSSPATRLIGGNAERGCFRLRDRGVSLGATTAADAQERTAPSSRSTAGAHRG